MLQSTDGYYAFVKCFVHGSISLLLNLGFIFFSVKIYTFAMFKVMFFKTDS